MIGMTLYHPGTGISGEVDATSVQPDGTVLARIKDHWLPVDELTAV